jgi:hypothetical protein
MAQSCSGMVPTTVVAKRDRDAEAFLGSVAATKSR